MNAFTDFRKYLLACSLIVAMQPLQGTSLQEATAQRDGQHPQEDQRAVAAGPGERAVPRHPAEHLLGTVQGA